uniref:Uncharacterized protein n=1 Tax=Aliivibrio wodanis TaxID=80852 RepID=A0A5Q4Z495_9GAMM|nr:hypothetical protein AW0309160_01368 [Aliivibrio wodanis]
MAFFDFLVSFTTNAFGILGVFVAVQGLTFRKNELVDEKARKYEAVSESHCSYPNGAIKSEILEAEKNYAALQSSRSLSGMSHFNNQTLVKTSRLPYPPVDKLFVGLVSVILRLSLVPSIFAIALSIFGTSSTHTIAATLLVFSINALLPSYIYKSKDRSASIVSGFGYFGEIDSILCNLHRDDFGHVSAGFEIYVRFLGKKIIFSKSYKARSMEDCVHEYLGLLHFCDAEKLGYYSIDHESNDVSNILIKDIRFGFIRTIIYVAYLVKAPFSLLAKLKSKG